MKRILKGISIAVVALVVLVFVLNSYVRVSYSPTQNIGIVEEFLFDRPIAEVFAPPWSKDYKRWDSASKASASVADLLKKFGTQDLTTGQDLSAERKQAEFLSAVAFKNASAISRAYLTESNTDLPDAYFEHFVPAMNFWQHGFAERNPALVRQGISNYNAFLAWMHSHGINDFKPMR